MSHNALALVTNTSTQTFNQGGWTTALDLDFTAQSNQTLSPDGNYTIGGLSWKRENSANDLVAMAIVNGTGLVIQPHTASYGSGTGIGFGTSERAACLIWLPLSQLSITNLDWTTGLRIWINVSAQTLSTAGDGLVWGIDNDVGSGFGAQTTWYSIFGARSSTGATSPQLTAWDYTAMPTSSAGNIAMPSGVTTWNASNATSVLYINSIVPFGGGYQPLVSYGTAYSSGWTNDLIPWAARFDNPNAGRSTEPAVGYANNPSSPGSVGSTMGIVLAGTGNSGSGFIPSMTITRIRVDYRL